jgi:heat shock protein HslJ
MGLGRAGLLVVWIASVAMAAKPHVSDLTGTSWRLVEFKGSDNTVLKPKDRNKYTVVFGDGGRLSAVVDCNQGHGSWDSDGPGHVTFGALGLTRMMCPEEGAKLDGNLETQWENVTSYVMKGGHLFLSLKTDAGTYEFERLPGSKAPAPAAERSVAAGVAFAGAAVSLATTDWRLVKVEDEEVKASDPAREAHMVLDAKTHRVSGSGGCNQLVGGWKANGDHIVFSQMASTMMACADGMDAEGKFMKALGSTRMWTISGRELELRDDAGAVVAVFEARS